MKLTINMVCLRMCRWSLAKKTKVLKIATPLPANMRKQL